MHGMMSIPVAVPVPVCPCLAQTLLPDHDALFKKDVLTLCRSIGEITSIGNSPLETATLQH